MSTIVRVPIEVDVTYTNQKWYSHKQKKKDEKHYILGVYQRNGKAIIKVLENNQPETIHNAVLECAQQGCILFSEAGILPQTLHPLYEINELQPSDHHVRGEIHINNVKNMWGALKRLIKRTHIHVSREYLELYCSQVVWDVNTRHMSPFEKFDLAISNSVRTAPRKNSSKKVIK